MIDSPNQQDQDASNHLKILNFIRDEKPADSQLILGLVDDCGVEFGGDVIEMTEENWALQKDEYPSILSLTAPYEDAHLSSQME